MACLGTKKTPQQKMETAIDGNKPSAEILRIHKELQRLKELYLLIHSEHLIKIDEIEGFDKKLKMAENLICDKYDSCFVRDKVLPIIREVMKEKNDLIGSTIKLLYERANNNAHFEALMEGRITTLERDVHSLLKNKIVVQNRENTNLIFSSNDKFGESYTFPFHNDEILPNIENLNSKHGNKTQNFPISHNSLLSNKIPEFQIKSNLQTSINIFTNTVNNIILNDANGHFIENITEPIEKINKETVKQLSFAEQLCLNLEQPSIITHIEKQQLYDFLSQFEENFSEKPGLTYLEPHKINTGSHAPIARNPYPESPAKQIIIRGEVDKMLELDLIEPSYSPWSSPVTLVKKPDESIRFCIDYRALNKITISDQFPMPLMASIIQNLKGAKYLSSLDMTMGYFQCAVDENDKIKTAFTCSAGLYQFKVLPFGLKCAPSTFNRLMSRVLREVYGTCAMAYLDDIVIFSHTFEQHLKDLETIFVILKRENLKIKLRKCQFCRVDFKFLGSIVREGRLQIDPDKIKSVATFQTPRSVKEVQRFLGLTGWLRKHVKEYAHISRPLSALTGGKNPKKNFFWSKQCQEAFELLKIKLMEPGTALTLPDFSLPFVIECDAADHGIAGVLCQRHKDDSFHVIEYASRILHPREVNYTISEKELLAVIYSIAKFKAYIADKPFKIITDHNALRWLLKTKDLSGRLTRWALKLQEYDYTVEYRKGAEHLIPDALSRGTTIKEIFNPDEEDERMSPPTTHSIVNMIEVKLGFSDVTPEEIKEEQLKEKWIAEMINKIQTIIKNDAQIFFKKYYILKDMLFYKSNKDSDEYRIVLPRTLINRVLLQFHNDPTGGHFGIQKTMLKVQSRMFWHHMKDDITTFIKNLSHVSDDQIAQHFFERSNAM